MQDHEWRPRIDPRTKWIEVDGEAIAIGPSPGDLHLLNPTGAAMLELLDGSTSIRELAHDVSGVFGIPQDDALEQLLVFAAGLAEYGLVEGPALGREQFSTRSPELEVEDLEVPAGPRYLTAPPDP